MRAVARDASKAAPWVERGCDLAIAEMTDASALTRAFAGADGVFVLIPPIFDPSAGFVEVCAVISALRGALAEARPVSHRLPLHRGCAGDPIEPAQPTGNDGA